MSVVDGTPAEALEDPATALEPGRADLEPAPEPKRKKKKLTLNRDFLLLWSGAGASFLGSRVSAIAYTLLVFWATGSASKAGLVGFAALLPNLLVQLPAGALVDQWDRRWTMVICDLGRMLAVGSVAIAVFSGHIWLPHLLVVAFVESSMTVFYRLSERAAVRNVVEPDQLNAALASNEARGQATGLLGQPGGTVLYAVSQALPFGASALLHGISLTTLLFIRKPLQQPRDVDRKPAHMFSRVAEGFRFVWSQKYLRRALALIAATNLLFQVLSLGVIVIVREQGGSPATVGFILVVNGVGGMLGALTSNFYLGRFGIRRIIMATNISWAILMPLFGFTGNPIALAAIYSAIIYGAGVSNVAGIVYQVKTTPDRMQGRVGSMSALLTSGVNSLGALAAGFILEALGTRDTMLVVGGFMFVLAVTSLIWFGGRRAAEQERELDVELTK
jgi:predicted MFS family arabinose efflux permease